MAQSELPGAFTVTDERAPEEISEISRLYLDGNLVATFRLGLSKSHETQTIRLPAGRLDVDYALCGEITIVHNGHQETHQVSSEGQLHNPEGHSLDAVGSNNFTDFFLVDYDDSTVATHRHGRAAVCASPSA
ncbi:hypothetical protein GMO_12870 [Gluconobacter morbifer G707]|uniref:Uncharacterized protein n=1 Tax=Gluconobacter morbifer G707 TaxID=1088869 RepID=G6XI77_9PROT|nr:hypothetical protein GMO_12870 [Gluconobacter morbifer G707]